jgi:ribulose-bisphosphate carboxylase large chain
MERLTATYLVRSPAATIDARARALAIEQSIEMPIEAVRQPHVLDEMLARVADIRVAEPDAFGAEQYLVRLELATATIGGQLTQLLNMAFGNCSLQPDVMLVDLDLPPDLVTDVVGPRYGAAGLRALVGAPDTRPLTCTALKPQGLDPAQLAELAGTFAEAGIDIVKDDHGLAGQASAPFAQRVAACQAAVESANRRTGGSTCYAPSLVGGPSVLRRQLQIAANEGVRTVLVAPMLVGLPAFAELVAEHEEGPAVLAHPAMGGAARFAPELVMGKLFRLAGADAVIFPNHGGRFAYSPETCRNLADATRRPWGRVRPSLPVPAGGMTPQRVPEMISFYGHDVMLLIGGALLQAGDGLNDAARQFVQEVAAAGAAEVSATPASEGNGRMEVDMEPTP